MRWLPCVILLAGCLRARATAVHPTEQAQTTSSGGPGIAIARGAPPPADDASTNLVSVELGAMVPFTAADSATRVQISPGVRIFGSQADTVLFGVAVGADYVRKHSRAGFAVEGSVYVGDGGTDPVIINQSLDLFAGVAVRSSRARSSIAFGPSAGILAMPGGNSVVMLGLGLRVMTGRD